MIPAKQIASPAARPFPDTILEHTTMQDTLTTAAAYADAAAALSRALEYLAAAGVRDDQHVRCLQAAREHFLAQSHEQEQRADTIPTDEVLAAMTKADLLGLFAQHDIRVPLGAGKGTLVKVMARHRAEPAEPEQAAPVPTVEPVKPEQPATPEPVQPAAEPAQAATTESSVESASPVPAVEAEKPAAEPKKRAARAVRRKAKQAAPYAGRDGYRRLRQAVKDTEGLDTLPQGKKADLLSRLEAAGAASKAPCLYVQDGKGGYRPATEAEVWAALDAMTAAKKAA
jgi:hypothetical protein